MNKSFVNVITFATIAITFSTASQAVLINFDTRQNGTVFTGQSDSFGAAEYSGVAIQDSDPTSGSSFVNLSNPLNVGTSISGYYVNIGAFAGINPTSLTFIFGNQITSFSFDFATPSGDLSVSTFDSAGVLISQGSFLGSSSFINQAGFELAAGQVSLAGFTNVASVIIQANENQGLIVDNVNYTLATVPLPASSALVLAGLLGFTALRKSRAVKSLGD
jgi:hypothetical protein